jgi:hypothetical protein
MDDTTKTAILGYDSILFVQSQGDIYFRSNGGSRKGTLLANGNWLFGTTVDSSALLQIGTNTTTLAGGAIFGTDTGFLRTAAGSLQIQHQGGTTPKFQLAGSVGPTVFLEFGHDGTQSYLSTQAAHNLDLRYNATAVLKLTSTTNAQIVGTKTLSFGATANATFGVSADTTAGILTITPPSSGSISLAGITAVGGATPSSTTYLNHPAGTTGVSPMRIPHGSAPTSPVNGDIWTTTAGIFVRINGATVGPLT